MIVELVVKYDGKPLLHAERNAANLLLAIIESSLLYPFTFESMEMIFSHTKLQLYFFHKKKKKLQLYLYLPPKLSELQDYHPKL